MSTSASPLLPFRELYLRESADLRRTFDRSGDGAATARTRATMVQSILQQIWADLTETDGANVCLVATGGFGRNELFPFSDVDVLFLCASDSVEERYRERIRSCTQSMWDTGMRASPVIRTLKECERVDPDNLEFTVSLLDRRLLCGDSDLYRRFETEQLPATVLREWDLLVHNLAEMARARHTKYGNTIFHLEPNIKECPGGLRDYHLTQWLQLLETLRTEKSWPRPSGSSFYATHNEQQTAYDFLAAARCFLHYRSGRDDNTLDWHAQDEAAQISLGLETGGTADPAYWMRSYYRHARMISRRASLLLETLPPPRRSFYRQFRRKRTPIPGTDFFLENGRIDLASGAGIFESESMLRIFGLIAQHGHKLAPGAEERVAEAVPVLAVQLPEGPFLWNCLREVLLGPWAADALRTMHALGVLELLIPEFHGIDSLVIRDAYHRYTVDEHTFLVIDNVHRLRQPQDEREKRIGALSSEIERSDLFFLALLMHDTGKARRTGDHAAQSVELCENLFVRLEFDPEERDTVRKLIRHHLEMSAALRRDIFDAENVRAFAQKIGSQAQLKMLAVMTYADIRGVSPDALTPWKAENLWQLYIGASNFLDRSVDEARYHVSSDQGLLERILVRMPEHADKLRVFLEGLPQRYLQTRSPEQVREHVQLAAALRNDPVQLAFRTVRHLNEITLITADRPALFADVAGVLSAWGMNIVKADAFANDAGTIVDTFQFTDPYRTLELNPSERDRFLASLRDVLAGRVPLEQLLKARRHSLRRTPPKVSIETRLEFDSESSTHSTLLQIVTQDTPGLLRAIALAFAACRCNIEVALIDTEGELAVDVFYLTAQGQKLDEPTTLRLTGMLTDALNGDD